MSASDKFTVAAHFGDGDKDFCLKSKTGDSLDLLRELERKFDAGIFVLFRQIYSGTYRLDVIREVIRTGLIGGGATTQEAAALIKTYFDHEPLTEHAALALEVLGAILFGKGEAVPAEFAA
ncbi:gene transfer agent family protein [Mesorhizobium sp. AA22]|uniref:gene transfer agent family protein n=1 Tax=Mesorhizobium sp. AA22 TaxID=1854057 RepID=UPI0007EDAC1E|nr:gene transfer agent family protein [Mesorhizobium sp. AA22]QIA23102.1 gene transfer agent family protein [Mesorhizobium sp. AA22]